MVRVLLIDPDARTYRTLRAMLEDHFVVHHQQDPTLSVDRTRRERPDLVLLDIDLDEFDGLALLKALVSLPEAPPVVVLTALRHTRMVVKAVRSGAADYVTKPFALRELTSAMIAALERRPRNGHVHPGAASPLSRIIGESAGAREQRRKAELFAAADAPVMVLGESGTGKDLFARVTHRLSARGEGPCVAVNCGAIPETLFESEMFGVTRGAYTDAVDRPGHFEQAEGGTLFLDEVGELTRSAQVKLLRALEERTIRRVGSAEERPVDVRIIVASNRPVRADVENGRFRTDLFYRLSVLTVELAPLRERREDVPLLATHFLTRPGGAAGRFSDAAMEKLMSYTWPGNIRELRNLVERAGLVAYDGVIQPTDVIFV
jgi:DNA-binding NtrC family response regulator